MTPPKERLFYASASAIVSGVALAAFSKPIPVWLHTVVVVATFVVALALHDRID